MTKFVLWLVLIVSLTSVVSAQNKGFIVGRITEQSTGQPVAAARVEIAGIGEAQADEKGMYRLEVAQGVYAVRFSHAGFATLVINQVGVTAGRDTVVNAGLDVTLTAEVDVRSETFAENVDQPVSSVTLRREDLRTTPGSGGDPLRAINSLPGVTAASAEFADLIVRGGTPNENLTYIDNIPVRDFTYFTDQYDGPRGGRASILPPDAFDRAEFSAGGFGSKYGDRMSSVLDVGIREANRRRVQGVLFADSGTMGGSLDIPITKRGGWLFSARRSYIDVALDVAGIADAGIIGYPRTFDLTNKFVYDLTPRNKLTFTALNFFEKFNQTDDQSQNIDRRTDRFRMRRTSQRHILGTTLSTTINAKTLAQTTLWHNIDHNDGSFFIPYTTLLQRQRDLRGSQTGVKEDVSWMPDQKLRLSFGGALQVDRANYYTFERAGNFYSPLEEEYVAPTRQNRFRLSNRTSGNLYAQAVINVTNRFSITPGVRLDHYGLTGETLASPRFAARFNASNSVALTFATGIYRQPPSVFQFSLTPLNADLKTQSATHIVGGLEWIVREDTRIRVEAFRKTYDDLVVQQVGPTPAFVSNGRFYNTGSGTASGFEVSVHRALTGFFTGQASYGYLKSDRKLTANGLEFSSDLERPHQLTLIGITSFKGFNIAAKYRIASGLPYTRRTPVTIGTSTWIQRIASYADINALRLPNFASLDLRAERRFAFKRVSISPYIDIFNLTNYRSVVQPSYEFYRRTPLMLSEDKRLPIFGFRFEF